MPRKLNDCVDVHWWTTPNGMEFIKRTMFDLGFRSYTAIERHRWFKKGWENKLEEQRFRHRVAGIPDRNFYQKPRKGKKEVER